MLKTIIATLIITSGLFASAEQAQPELNLRNVRLNMKDGKLTGRVAYSLLVGTFYEWNTDPTAVPGLFSEINTRTDIRARVDFFTVSIDSEDLFLNPFLIMTGNRFFSLSDEEIENTRAYIRAGGFIYADDCGGADYSFRHMLSKVFPDDELVEIEPDHPIFSSHYDLTEVPKILDLYGGSAKAYGLFIDNRLSIVYTYDTDVPCGWEKNPDGSFVHLLTPGKHEDSIRFGVNVIMYALQELYARLNPEEEKAEAKEEKE